MRKFLKLSYNGLAFHGWQRQPGDISVQQTIEDALQTILRVPVAVTGAGRTDAGVHARLMYAHFDIPDTIGDTIDKHRLLAGINRLIGPDVAVHDIHDVAADAHARFDATSRTYKYFVAYAKSPFLRDRAWTVPSRLDLWAMNEAATLLLETDDFTSFAKLHSDARTNICRVTRADWKPWDNPYGVPGLVFTVTADRFLRNMVRALVGTLTDVGRGKLDYEGMKRVIASRDRCAAGTSVPPQGLFLWNITYPYL